MKTPCGKHNNVNNNGSSSSNGQHRFSPYLFKKESLEHSFNRPVSTKILKPSLFSYSQACEILKAIELNGRKKLSKKCIAHLAVFVSHAWEEKPCPEKIQKVYYMINSLLDTTNMDINEPFEVALQKFCASSVSTPTICSSVTLLVAMGYIERLNKRYKDLKGTAGCSLRMIMVAYIMASKYIHDSLQLIIYTNARNKTEMKDADQSEPITPPTSPKRIFIASAQPESIHSMLNEIDEMQRKCTDKTLSTDSSEACTSNDTTTAQKDEIFTPITNKDDTATRERNIRIARMELEFFHFLNYDLSVQDPIMLVKWAQNYEPAEENHSEKDQDYNSADEGDDEMDEEDS